MGCRAGRFPSQLTNGLRRFSVQKARLRLRCLKRTSAEPVRRYASAVHFSSIAGIADVQVRTSFSCLSLFAVFGRVP